MTKIYRVLDIDSNDEWRQYDYDYEYIVNGIINWGHDAEVSSVEISGELDDYSVDELEELNWVYVNTFKA